MGVLSPVPMHPSGRRHLGFLVIDKPQNLPRSYGRQPMLLWCNEIGAAGETATGKSVVSSTDARVSNTEIRQLRVTRLAVENASDWLPSETGHHEIWVAAQTYQQHTQTN